MTLKRQNRPFIVAEIGSNWKRYPLDPFQTAKRHIEDAAMCGVDAVKFQLFTDKELYGTDGKDEYALPEHWLPMLKKYAEGFKVQFLCSAFSPQGVKKVDRFVDVHKIASSEANDPDIRAGVVSTGKPFIISVAGMSQRELDDIESDLPDKDFIFMECVAKYPAETKDYCLDNIGNRVIGLSDHTLTNTLALGALSRGAVFFEKHFDALKDVPRGKYITDSPDSVVSVSPKELREYVDGLHTLYGSMHKSIRAYSDPLLHYRWRRRLKIIKPVAKGEKLLQNQNYGSFRSLKDDLNPTPPIKAPLFHEKIAKKDLEVGQALLTEHV